MRRVVLLTDFGTADGYAAAMAGVIAAAAPDASIEHAAHDVAPGDILGAAIALQRYATRYPRGTVHLVVVDPGVGTARRPLAVTADGRHYVAPDNGVLTLVLRHAGRVDAVAVRDVGRGGGAAPTFHGRDIFAPAAAALARGQSLSTLGPPVDDPVRLAVPEPVRTDGAVRGEVIHVDRFGTLISNVPAAWVRGLGDGARVSIEGASIGPLRRTYGDVASGSLLALIGSLDLLEISVRDGRAADRLGLGRGAAIEVASAG